MPITGSIPNPADIADESRRTAMQRALNYMGLTPGTPLVAVTVDKVFYWLLHQWAD